jgi:regulator of sigma E protease
MSWVLGALGAILAIFVLVVVHEFGHFLAAKLFGVGVPVFSVGMGPRIGGWAWRGTDYRLSALPIGGYVQMSGADPFGEEDFEALPIDPAQDFMRKPVWQRLIILVAGPAANIILPICIFTLLFMGGYPEYPAQLGVVSFDSPAWHAGLRQGDRVVTVDDTRIQSWKDFENALSMRAGAEVRLVVERQEGQTEVVLPAGAFVRRMRGLIDSDSLGISVGRPSSRVGVADPASPAGVAGIETFDAITQVNGRSVLAFDDLLAALSEAPTHRVKVVRARTGQPRAELDLTLTADERYPDWGLVPADLFVGEVMEGKPAQEAGVQVGDRLLEVNGAPIQDFGSLRRLVSDAAADREDRRAGTRLVQLTIEREGQRLERTLVPVLIDDSTIDGARYRAIIGIGALPDARVYPERTIRYYGPIEALTKGVDSTWRAVVNVVTTLNAMVRGKTNPLSATGGPVAILSVTGQSLLLGIHAYAGTIAQISVSLAIVNLLPVPALDGGQIVVYLVEWIRGRPLSPALRVRIQMIGVLILFSLIIVVTVSDVYKLFFPEL